MYNIQADNPDHSDYLQSCLEFTICTKNDPRRKFAKKIYVKEIIAEFVLSSIFFILMT